MLHVVGKLNECGWTGWLTMAEGLLLVMIPSRAINRTTTSRMSIKMVYYTADNKTYQLQYRVFDRVVREWRILSHWHCEFKVLLTAPELSNCRQAWLAKSSLALDISAISSSEWIIRNVENSNKKNLALCPPSRKWLPMFDNRKQETVAIINSMQ